MLEIVVSILGNFRVILVMINVLTSESILIMKPIRVDLHISFDDRCSHNLSISIRKTLYSSLMKSY